MATPLAASSRDCGASAEGHAAVDDVKGTDVDPDVEQSASHTTMATTAYSSVQTDTILNWFLEVPYARSVQAAPQHSLPRSKHTAACAAWRRCVFDCCSRCVVSTVIPSPPLHLRNMVIVVQALYIECVPSVPVCARLSPPHHVHAVVQHHRYVTASINVESLRFPPGHYDKLFLPRLWVRKVHSVVELPLVPWKIMSGTSSSRAAMISKLRRAAGHGPTQHTVWQQRASKAGEKPLRRRLLLLRCPSQPPRRGLLNGGLPRTPLVELR